jgi:hypothetical protein
MTIPPLGYIDPGSGSILAQLLITSCFGGIILFWKRIKRFFGFGRRDDAKGKEPDGDGAADSGKDAP